MRAPGLSRAMAVMAAAPVLLLAAPVLLLGACSSGTPVSKAPATTQTTAAEPSSASSTSSSSSTSSTTAPADGTALCGFTAPGQAHYSHVVWIWMENHPYGAVIGSASAPYENEVARRCGLATNYHNVTHPSLPNYIAATSGLPASQLGAQKSDCDPSPSCSLGPSVPSIFSQAPTWKGYAESMPTPCAKGSSGDYAARHNPPVYYQSLAGVCGANDVNFSVFGQDLAAGRLPAFSFVTPNLVDDTHDGSVADGDRWLRSTLGEITASQAYRSATVAVFVVWDEGEGGSTSDCATNTTDEIGRAHV